MIAGFNALAFPSECPSEYIPLDNEPPFIAAQHLSLEFPDSIFSLHDLGYCDQDIATCESSFGYCNAFRILSD